MSGESTRDTGAASERWEDKPNRHAYCDAEIARLHRSNDVAEHGRAVAVVQLSKAIARAERAEAAIERTLAYCAEIEAYCSAERLDTPPWVASVRAHLGQPPAEKEEDPNDGETEAATIAAQFTMPDLQVCDHDPATLRPGESPKHVDDIPLPGDADER
jgi:hypothetical protein